MTFQRSAAIFFLVLTVALGYFVWQTETNPDSNFRFKLGLDLTGGSELIYRADVSSVEPAEVDEALAALQAVIERRVNAFGVGEPVIRVEESSLGGEGVVYRLAVELPGVTDIEEAKARIGQTPLLEFKTLGVNTDALGGEEAEVTIEYLDTGLTGRFVEGATLNFQGGAAGGGISEPTVLLEFNSEGKELFANLTQENIGAPLAIFLDGESISEPIVREAITDGVAVISGNFEVEEARELVRNLNLGALPVPIELEKTQIVGPTLGRDTIEGGVTAGLAGFGIVLLFLAFWYRLPGLVSVLALIAYVVLMLTAFKLFSITLTAAGIAGFLLSVGMAVDANVVVFERLKEELQDREKGIRQAVKESFARSWPAVRDANLTTLIVSAILFFFGTSIVRGFALVFGFGVLLSMFSALVIAQSYLLAISPSLRKRLRVFIPFRSDKTVESNQ